MSIKLKKWKFSYNGMDYFRGDAHKITLGCFGEKKDPVGAIAYLAVENQIQTKFISPVAKIGQQMDLTLNQFSRGDVEGQGKFKIFGIPIRLQNNWDWDSVKDMDLKIIPIFFTEGDLKKVLNSQARGAKSFLKREGKDGRVVTEVLIVVSAQFAHSLTVGTGVNVSAKGKAIDLSFSMKNGKSETVKLAPGATFAYRMHKVKKWNNGKTKIMDMEDDRKGMG